MLKNSCVTYVSEHLLPMCPVYTLIQKWGRCVTAAEVNVKMVVRRLRIRSSSPARISRACASPFQFRDALKPEISASSRQPWREILIPGSDPRGPKRDAPPGRLCEISLPFRRRSLLRDHFQEALHPTRIVQHALVSNVSANISDLECVAGRTRAARGQ